MELLVFVGHKLGWRIQQLLNCDGTLDRESSFVWLDSTRLGILSVHLTLGSCRVWGNGILVSVLSACFRVEVLIQAGLPHGSSSAFYVDFSSLF